MRFQLQDVIHVRLEVGVSAAQRVIEVGQR
jgi:hypothetical protein